MQLSTKELKNVPDGEIFGYVGKWFVKEEQENEYVIRISHYRGEKRTCFLLTHIEVQHLELD